jgi:DNA-binding GntR family transcriptional regulator
MHAVQAVPAAGLAAGQTLGTFLDRMTLVAGSTDSTRARVLSRTLDRSSYEPAYIQLVNMLRHAIASGEYHAGDQLPTEAELCAAYDVSPMTVRRAISMLLDQGAVSTARGRGTFVEPLRLATATFDLSEFHDLLDDEQVTVRILEARVLPAGARAATSLAIAVGTRIISIRRLLERAGEPLFYHRESLLYDPTRPTVEAELGVTSLRDMFEGSPGAGPKKGELIIHASVLTADEAHHVRAPVGAAALVLEHLFYDYDDKPMSWGRFVCRGGLLQFRATVGVQAPYEGRKRPRGAK